MRRGVILAYGLLGLPLAFAALPVYLHVPAHYAAVAGLDLALIGAVLALARLGDALLDPWLGWLVDRRSRRALLALALAVLALGFAALFNPPEAGALPWLVGALGLTYLGYSLASIAYQAWGAAMTEDSAERTRLTASREGWGLAGVLLAALLPSLLASPGDSGLRDLGWVLPPLLVVAALVAFSRVPGDLVGATADGASPVAAFRRLAASAAYRRLLAVFVVNGVASAIPATLFVFFVSDVLVAPKASGGMLALYFIAGAAGMPFWLRRAARLGRVTAWRQAMALAMLAFAGAALLGPEDLVPFALICLASGLALGADLALPAALAADLGQGLRLPGACFGVWNLATKANLALAAGIALPLVAALGYRPGDDTGLAGLTFTYAVLPLAFKALAWHLAGRWEATLETSP